MPAAQPSQPACTVANERSLLGFYIKTMVPVVVSSRQIHLTNTLLAAPAERQAWKGISLSFHNPLQTATRHNGHTCTVGYSNSKDTPTWLVGQVPAKKSKRWVSEARRNSLAGAE